MAHGRKGRLWLSLAIFLLIPLFFLNIRASHDWGDDFAQYILQAKNLAEGKPQKAGSYIFNPDYPIYAPPLYPVGFPILLSPVYRLFGNDILAFNYFQTLILFLLAVSIFVFLKRFIFPAAALLLTLVLAYNPWTLEFKTEIIAELPFSLFFLWTVIFYLHFSDNPTWGKGIATGCLAGFTMLIKPAGVILLLAASIDWLLTSTRRKHDSKVIFKNYLALLAAAAFFYFLISKILIPSSVETAGHFYSLYSNTEKLNKRFNTNAVYYIDRFQELFKYTNPDWDLFAGVMKSFALALLLLGLFGKLINRFAYLEILTLVFLLSVLLFPNTTQGFRYLLPVFPMMLLYVYYGFESIQLGRLNRKMFFAVTCIFCLFQYKTTIENIAEHQQQIIAGAQESASKEAFAAINQMTKENDVVAFIKPRALTLYAERTALTNSPNQDNESMKSFFEKHQVRYFLTSTNLQNPALDGYLRQDTQAVELIWKNEKFSLYRKR